jgi:hypothetical protein
LALAGIDVAIAERRAGQGLPDARTTWFGPPTAA